MALGLKISKYDTHGENGNAQVNQATKPQTVALHTTDGSTVGTAYVGGTGGTSANTTPLTILVNFKTAAGVAKSDGFIVRQRGRKVFDVQSVSGGAATLTRCTLVESGTLAASQMYIKIAYQGGGTQYASRISNRYVWTASSAVRYPYVVGNTDTVTYHAGTADTYFKNAAGDSIGKLFAIVEGA